MRVRAFVESSGAKVLPVVIALIWVSSATPAFAQTATDNAQARSHPANQTAGANSTASYTIAFRNIGTTTWTGSGYVLKRENDGATFPLGTRDAQGGCDPLPPQGDCAWQFSPSRSAPTPSTWHYRMYHNGSPFGDAIDVQFVAPSDPTSGSPATGGGTATTPPASGTVPPPGGSSGTGTGTGSTTTPNPAAGAPTGAGGGGGSSSGGGGGGAGGGGSSSGGGGGGSSSGGGGGGRSGSGGGAGSSPATAGGGATQASPAVLPDVPVCAVGLPGNARPLSTTVATQPSAGTGQVLAPDLGLSVLVPPEARPGGQLTVSVTGVSLDSLPPTSTPLFQFGDRAFELSLSGPLNSADTDDGHCRAPITLSYQPTTGEQALAAGDLTRLRPALWTGAGWLPLDCQIDLASGTASCVSAYVGLIAVVIAPAGSGNLDYDIDGGHFYQETNGFNGAGDTGFAVQDDLDAPFWSEYQRLGGVQRFGYPISGRFQHDGLLTQVFQRGALEWHGDTGQAEPVNIMDELSHAGADAWLDHADQVPPAPPGTDDSAPLSDQTVAQREALLGAYPSLQQFWLSDPDPLADFGLPVAVKNYGSVTTVRLQRAAVQLWNVPMPWADAGTIDVTSAGDLAKAAGLWPAAAITPSQSFAVAALDRRGFGVRGD